MLNIALDLAIDDQTYEDMASKFFEHFTQISDAINQMSDGVGLWDEQDGFYYDHLSTDSCSLPLRVRSMVGLVPLMACLVLDDEYVQKLPGFKKRLDWFLSNRKDLASQVGKLQDSPEFCWFFSLFFSIFFSENRSLENIWERNVPPNELKLGLKI